MSYKHWWACHPTETAYTDAWPEILRDSRRIVASALVRGVDACGPGGQAWPVIDRHGGIRIGGDAAHGRHAQPLLLSAPHRKPHPSPCGTPAPTTGSVDTSRYPYDTVVAAILLRCHQLLGNHFIIRSDGGWDTEWAHGARLGQLGARTLVTDLFGPITSGSPLNWPSQPTHYIDGRPSRA